MSPFTVFVLCLQLCLIQSVLSQKYGGSGSRSYSSGSSCGSYGGQGCGVVSTAGTIDACGTTCVTGSVPVCGSACFDGCAPACGSVSICGQCECGCN